MADGKVIIETDLDSSGIEKGLNNTQKAMKAQAAKLAAEYRKQGMSSSDAFKKAWSEIERTSKVSSSSVKNDFEGIGKSAGQAADSASQKWELSSSKIGKAASKIGSLASKGLKVATTAIAGTATALSGVGIAAIKTGADFEAQMSRVQAISGATGEEFDALRELAIQLGADTSFSASSAAEGMENLASAGFETNEIMDAMPGMLNLAAASGEDLATSADIAASTLNAFGMEAGEAAHVADVLAENANRTNSSVADTGEAMKYIAPLAHAAGISMEETAAAIGIMADAGIQGSQAGTTLRGALSRLSRPTDTMKIAMDELGISFYNSEGKMKSLSEQVGMLKKATANMTDEQRNNYLVTLYGQEALSGMLALMEAGEDELASLTKSYEECDGAAEKAAKTMQDNLNGALEELGGSAETLGILFYDSIAGNLKKTVKSVTKSVNQITDAFKKGGIDAAVKQAGKEIANLATEAAKGAPKMINTAAKFIKSFVQGISDNKGELITAAGEIAKALADGLILLLPPKMQEPVRQAVDAISRSFTEGGLNSAIDTAGNLFSGMIDIVSELAEVALPLLTSGLDFVAENLDAIVPLLAAATAGYVAYQAAVTGVEAVTKLVTAAQTAWNTAMSMSPIGLVVGAVAALTAGLAVAEIAQRDESDAIAEANAKLADQAQKIRETQKARQEAVADIETEYGYYQQLWDELQKIVDQNGKIKEGYEERANFITATLSDALGKEISITDNVIDKYGELKASIDQLIQKKKAEAILSVYEESYTEALKNRKDAQAELARTYDDYKAALNEVNRLEQEYERLSAEARNGNTLAAVELETLIMKQNNANDALEEATYAYEDAKLAVSEYESTIANFETAMGAVEAGSANAEAAIQALTDGLIRAENATEEVLAQQVQDFKTKYDEMKLAAEDGNSGITTSMVEGARAMWLMAEIEHEKGSSNNKAKIAQYEQELAEIFNATPAKQAAENSGKETMEAKNRGTESVDTKTPVQNKLNEESAAWTEGSASAKEAANTAGTETAQSHVEGMESVDTATAAGEKGTETGQMLADAAESQKAVVEAAGRELVDAILSGMSQSDAHTLMKELGYQIASGLSQGVSSNQGLVVDAVNILVEATKNAIINAAINETAKQEGTKATTDMRTAITSGTPGVKSAVVNLCTSSKNALKSARIWSIAKEEGTKATTQMRTAITSGTPGVVTAVKTLCNNSINALKAAQLPAKFKTESTSAVKNFTQAITTGTPTAVSAAKALGTKTYEGLKNVNLSAKGKTEGTKLGNGLASGINAQRGAATSAGISLGMAAKSGLESVNLYSAGYTIGAQLCAGIAAGISANAAAAAAAAASAASQAAAAARANLQIHSPSRVGMEIGKMFDAGIAGGIEENTDLIEKASESMTDKIRKSVDLGEITQGFRKSLRFSADQATAKMTQDTRIRKDAEKNGNVDQSIHMVNHYHVPVASPSQVARTQREAARKLLGGVR